MSENFSETNEYQILGFKVRFNPGVIQGQDINGKEIVDLVSHEAKKISSASPQLDKGQIAILVALKIAAEKKILENEYKENIFKFHKTAKEALELIDDISPSTS